MVHEVSASSDLACAGSPPAPPLRALAARPSGWICQRPSPSPSLVYCRGTSSWGCKVSCEKYIELRENQRKGSEKSKVRSQGLCALGPPRARVCGVGVTSLYTGAPLAPRPELPATPCPEGRRGQQELERWGDGWPCEESSRLD